MPGLCLEEGATTAPRSCPLWVAKALAAKGLPVAPTDAPRPSRAVWAPSREGVLLLARLSDFTESEIAWKKTMHFSMTFSVLQVFVRSPAGG